MTTMTETIDTTTEDVRVIGIDDAAELIYKVAESRGPDYRYPADENGMRVCVYVINDDTTHPDTPYGYLAKAFGFTPGDDPKPACIVGAALATLSPDFPTSVGSYNEVAGAGDLADAINRGLIKLFDKDGKRITFTPEAIGLLNVAQAWSDGGEPWPQVRYIISAYIDGHNVGYERASADLAGGE